MGCMLVDYVQKCVNTRVKDLSLVNFQWYQYRSFVQANTQKSLTQLLFKSFISKAIGHEHGYFSCELKSYVWVLHRTLTQVNRIDIKLIHSHLWNYNIYAMDHTVWFNQTHWSHDLKYLTIIKQMYSAWRKSCKFSIRYKICNIAATCLKFCVKQHEVLCCLTKISSMLLQYCSS